MADGFVHLLRPPQGTFSNIWRRFWLFQLGKMLLASSGQKPGIFLNIVKCTGQHPPTPFPQDLAAASYFRKPWLPRSHKMGALRRPRHGGAWEDGLVISPYKCGLRGLQSWDAEIEPRHTQLTPTKHHNKTSLRATPHHPPRPTSTPTPMPRSLHYPHLTTPHPTTRLTAFY